jgi:uncharacterized protein (UPF0303 family)
MDVTGDLRRIDQQEERLQFPRFDPDTAWQLGTAVRTLAGQRGLAVAIDVHLHGFPLFYCAMPGTTPDNAEWIRRKRNVVLRFFRSSYAVGLKHHARGTTLEGATGVSAQDYAAHGGSFPLRVTGGTCIGAVTASGLPQREDHRLVTAALAQLLGNDIADIDLDPAP